MKALLFYKFRNICIKKTLWTRKTNCFTIFVHRNFRTKSHSDCEYHIAHGRVNDGQYSLIRRLSAKIFVEKQLNQHKYICNKNECTLSVCNEYVFQVCINLGTVKTNILAEVCFTSV